VFVQNCFPRIASNSARQAMLSIYSANVSPMLHQIMSAAAPRRDGSGIHRFAQLRYALCQY
jgi:hypothetical protein